MDPICGNTVMKEGLSRLRPARKIGEYAAMQPPLPTHTGFLVPNPLQGYMLSSIPTHFLQGSIIILKFSQPMLFHESDQWPLNGDPYRLK
jgi:hypothetical protein